MKTLLIAEDDRILSVRLMAYLKRYRDQFETVAVLNGREAIETLKARQVSLLITDIQMPEVDGLELLAYVNRHHPAIPCFVMTAYDTPEVKKRLPKDIVRFFAKPVDMGLLAESILKFIHREIPRGIMHGISILSFLQLILMEQKTCLLEVERQGRPRGLMFFEKGVLCDATCGALEGEPAALELISKERAVIRFRFFPERKVARRITTDLRELIERKFSVEDEVSDAEWDEIIADVIG